MILHKKKSLIFDPYPRFYLGALSSIYELKGKRTGPEKHGTEVNYRPIAIEGKASRTFGLIT